MNRRYVSRTGVAVAACVMAAVITGVSATYAAGTHARAHSHVLPELRAAGIVSIPGMTQIMGGSTPFVLSKGSSKPSYSSLDARGGATQAWVDSAAIAKYGPPKSGKKGLQLPIPLAFARTHPGPCEVFVRILSFGSPQGATSALREPELTGAYPPAYTPVDAGAVGGGLLGSVSSPANDGLSEFRFHWVVGSTWIEVNVLGDRMNVHQARSVALRVRLS
jgi:hypothetical protein